MVKSILDLGFAEAREFFLKGESYTTIELPAYFKFSNLLGKLSKKLTESNLSDFYSTYTEDSKQKTNCPKDFEGVNYGLLNNKNGEYAWRVFQLIHPALYVSLAHSITKEDNWKTIIDKFKEFQGGDVECVSLPVIKSEEQKSDKAEQISSWWHNFEQKSITLALDYDYIFHTDIAECYRSIYTHSLSWALHTKTEAKKRENRDSCNFIGVVIDKNLQGMSNGQTNGIPQGSVLTDFIAEIVLGYADLKLSEKIARIPKSEYKIIRFRDDYRIFVNNPQIGREIIKELSNVLYELGMKLNPEKTKHSDDVISSSIKNDKLFWMENRTGNKSLEKRLLILYRFSKKYPNSGTLIKELGYFYNKMEKIESTEQNINVLISILTNIAFKNPKAYSITTAILSKCLEFVTEDRGTIIKKIKIKFEKLPNTELINLWLQRITLKAKGNITEYEGKLCEKVNNGSIKIWESDWLNESLKNVIESEFIIDSKVISEMGTTITSDEIALYDLNWY